MTIHVARLDDVCEINPRASKTLGNQEAVSFLPMAAVSEDGQIDFEEQREAGEVKKGYTYFERGDILVAKITPCFENGKATRTDSLTNPIGFGSTEFHVLRANNAVDASYLFHLIWNSKFRAVGAKNMTGSAGQKRVPVDFLKRLEIPLPPLSEQRRIAAILDKADALRRTCKCTLELIGALCLAEVDAAYQGIDPTALVGDVCDVQGGLQLSRSRVGLIEAPYLRVANVYRNRLDLTEIKTMRVTPAELERTLLAEGDILFVEGHGNPDEIGRCAVWDGSIDPCIHQNHLIRARPKSREIDGLTISFWLNSERGRQHLLRRGKTTSGLNTISVSDVKAAAVPLLPRDKRMRLLSKLQQIDELLKICGRQYGRFEVLFSSLQSRAFSGQL